MPDVGPRASSSSTSLLAFIVMALNSALFVRLTLSKRLQAAPYMCYMPYGQLTVLRFSGLNVWLAYKYSYLQKNSFTQKEDRVLLRRKIKVSRNNK